MSKYQTSSMGEYCKLLAEDAQHAIKHEVRTQTEDGDWKWVEDADLDPKQEVTDVIHEICYQLQMAMGSANAHEALADKSDPKGYFHKYMDETYKYHKKWEDDWAWIESDDDE